MHQMLATHINKGTRNGTFGKMLEKIEFEFDCKFIEAEVSISGYAVKRKTPAQHWSGKIDAVAIKIRPNDQGRSQDFSVGTHSFPSHLFTPPPPPQKKKIKVIFDSRVFYFKYININIFEIYFFIYFFILFIYLFFYYYFQVRNCVFAYR